MTNTLFNASSSAAGHGHVDVLLQSTLSCGVAEGACTLNATAQAQCGDVIFGQGLVYFSGMGHAFMVMLYV